MLILILCRLQRFEKTNEMLTNCNALCASRLKTVGPEFKKHTQLLQEMKKDLDYIFKKIRAIKTKLSAQYPDAFAEAQRSSLAEECEEDDCKAECAVTETQVRDVSNDNEDDNKINDNVKKKDCSAKNSQVEE